MIISVVKQIHINVNYIDIKSKQLFIVEIFFAYYTMNLAFSYHCTYRIVFPLLSIKCCFCSMIALICTLMDCIFIPRKNGTYMNNLFDKKKNNTIFYIIPVGEHN